MLLYYCFTLCHQGTLPLVMMLCNPDSFWFPQNRHLSPPAASACSWVWNTTIVRGVMLTKITLTLSSPTCYGNSESTFWIKSQKQKYEIYIQRRKEMINFVRFIDLCIIFCYFVNPCKAQGFMNWQSLTLVSKMRPKRFLIKREIPLNRNQSFGSDLNAKLLKDSWGWKSTISDRFSMRGKLPMLKVLHNWHQVKIHSMKKVEFWKHAAHSWFWNF